MWRVTRFEGRVTLGGAPNCSHINTLAIFVSPTRDTSGHIEHATRGPRFWLGKQGQLFSYKRSIKDGSGRRVTLLPGTTFLHVNRPLLRHLIFVISSYRSKIPKEKENKQNVLRFSFIE